jgi:phage-related protein
LRLDFQLPCPAAKPSDKLKKNILKKVNFCLTRRINNGTLFTMADKIIFARFFKTVAGNEPVREWLKSQTKDNKKIIGGDISAVEWRWPVGYPLVSKLDNDLWEVRTHLPEGICRVFFTVWENYMVLLHAMIKKSKKTPQDDLDLAKKRRNFVLSGGLENEQ